MKATVRTQKPDFLRKEGIIPGVVYGKDFEPVSIQVEYLEFIKALKEFGNTRTFKLKIDKKDHIVYIKDTQIEPLKHQILHFDLVKVKATDKIQANIPIVFENKDKLDDKGLVLEAHHDSIEVEFTVGKGVSNFVLDVGELEDRDQLFVKDIEISKDISVLVDLEELVCSIYKPSVVVEEEASEDDEVVTISQEETPAEE